MDISDLSVLYTFCTFSTEHGPHTLTASQNTLHILFNRWVHLSLLFYVLDIATYTAITSSVKTCRKVSHRFEILMALKTFLFTANYCTFHYKSLFCCMHCMVGRVLRPRIGIPCYAALEIIVTLLLCLRPHRAEALSDAFVWRLFVCRVHRA